MLFVPPKCEIIMLLSNCYIFPYCDYITASYSIIIFFIFSALFLVSVLLYRSTLFHLKIDSKKFSVTFHYCLYEWEKAIYMATAITVWKAIKERSHENRFQNSKKVKSNNFCYLKVGIVITLKEAIENFYIAIAILVKISLFK